MVGGPTPPDFTPSVTDQQGFFVGPGAALRSGIEVTGCGIESVRQKLLVNSNISCYFLSKGRCELSVRGVTRNYGMFLEAI